MRFIEEVVVEAFLPTIRSMLAERLRERGLTQTQVAETLGISQSAVSKYAQGDVEGRPAIRADRRVIELVDELAAGLAEGSTSQVQGLAEIEVLIRTLEQGDLLADLHEQAYPPLAGFDGAISIHDADSAPRTSARVLASVRQGLRVLETAGGFASLIPAVGANLVEARPDADGITDVAAVPGRILDIKGRPTVPADPEFGVSEHVAGVLLAARAAGTDARAAINVRYEASLVAALARDHETVEFDPETPIDAAIETRAAERPAASVFYQTGGFGVEPIVYLLADDAVAAAEQIRAVAE